MKLKNLRDDLLKQNQKLRHYINEIEGNLNWTGYKHFDDIEETNKSRVIREIIEKTPRALWSAGSFGLVPKH